MNPSAVPIFDGALCRNAFAGRGPIGLRGQETTLERITSLGRCQLDLFLLNCTLPKTEFLLRPESATAMKNQFQIELRSPLQNRLAFSRTMQQNVLRVLFIITYVFTLYYYYQG
jgi:hypothetical protein